jgi:hypothetical protein
MMHVDPHARLRNIVSNAIEGCAYVASRQEEGKMLVIDARRDDGRAVHLRFRGVQSSESSAEPVLGARLRFDGVASAGKFSLLSILWPPVFRGQELAPLRVRIRADDVRIDVVCQDAEWWED